jgi:hypothetical protein
VVIVHAAYLLAPLTCGAGVCVELGMDMGLSVPRSSKNMYLGSLLTISINCNLNSLHSLTSTFYMLTFATDPHPAAVYRASHTVCALKHVDIECRAICGSPRTPCTAYGMLPCYGVAPTLEHGLSIPRGNVARSGFGLLSPVLDVPRCLYCSRSWLLLEACMPTMSSLLVGGICSHFE